MRLLRLGLALLVFGAAPSALAQTPPPPAPEPPPPAPAPPPPPPEAPAPSQPPSTETPPPELPPAPEAVPAPAPATAVAPEPPSAERPEPNVAPAKKIDEPPPFVRAHQALTLEGRLGFSWRPPSDGFDDENALGSTLGLSLYLDLVDEFALGLEVDRTSLGSGRAISGLDSVNVDFAVTSAMLGLRAYPLRSKLVDVYVGLQVGLGFQSISATGTLSTGGLEPAVPYKCSGSDGPGFEIGGGAGARLMLTPRWGVAARIDATARRLEGEVVDACALGIGTTTSIAGSLNLGYDFDLAPQ